MRVTLGTEPTLRADTVVAEEPLEIRVDGRPLAVTLRTPGDDLDLAIGFLLGEGLIATVADIADIADIADLHHADLHHGQLGGVPADDGDCCVRNVVDMRLAPGVPELDVDLRRHFYATSSCGVCARASLDAVRLRGRYEIVDDPLRISAEVLVDLPGRLRRAQRLFAATGGLHAAALADADGAVLAVREDVGRHNAVDKIVGWAARAGMVPLRGHVLLVSGRASFELVQKAALAGVPVLAAVSAPSALAVDLAQECGMTLAGFVRGSSMSLYAGAQRVILPAVAAAH